MQADTFSLETAKKATYTEILTLAKEQYKADHKKNPCADFVCSVDNAEGTEYTILVGKANITEQFLSCLDVYGTIIFDNTALNPQDFLSYLGESKESSVLTQKLYHTYGSYNKIAEKIAAYKGCKDVWQEICKTIDSGMLNMGTECFVCKTENGNVIAVLEEL